MVGIFPDRDALIRLVGAVLAEHHDEWTKPGLLEATPYAVAGSYTTLLDTTQAPGRVVKEWGEEDGLAALRQLGVIPA